MSDRYSMDAAWGCALLLIGVAFLVAVLVVAATGFR